MERCGNVPTFLQESNFYYSSLSAKSVFLILCIFWNIGGKLKSTIEDIADNPGFHKKMKKGVDSHLDSSQPE